MLFLGCMGKDVLAQATALLLLSRVPEFTSVLLLCESGGRPPDHFNATFTRV